MRTTLILTGVGCLIAAIVGGSLKAFGIDFPAIASRTRQSTLGVLGLLLIAGAVAGDIPRQQQSGPNVVNPRPSDTALKKGADSARAGTDSSNHEANPPSHPKPPVVTDIGPATAPTLASLEVTFDLPKGDNRDHDTRTNVEISRSGSLIARANDVAHDVEFKDPGAYGPYRLNILVAARKDLFIGSTTTVTVFPNGNDRWITKVRIDARFSDSSVLSCSSQVLIVDQNANVGQFSNCPP
jgi:hypothetical protein